MVEFSPYLDTALDNAEDAPAGEQSAAPGYSIGHELKDKVVNAYAEHPVAGSLAMVVVGVGALYLTRGKKGSELVARAEGGLAGKGLSTRAETSMESVTFPSCYEKELAVSAEKRMQMAVEWENSLATFPDSKPKWTHDMVEGMQAERYLAERLLNPDMPAIDFYEHVLKEQARKYDVGLTAKPAERVVNYFDVK